MRKKIIALLVGALLSMATASYATAILNSSPDDNFEDYLVTPKHGSPYFATYAEYANSGNFLYISTGNNVGNFAQTTEDTLSAFLGYHLDLVETGISMTGGGTASGTWQTTKTESLIDFYVVKAADAYAMYEVLPADGDGSWSTFDLWNAGYGGNGALEISHFSGYNPSSTPVPEPGTMMLFGIGMLGLAVYGKRRMNKEA